MTQRLYSECLVSNNNNKHHAEHVIQCCKLNNTQLSLINVHLAFNLENRPLLVPSGVGNHPIFTTEPSELTFYVMS